MGWALITHPFHPLKGQRFAILKIRKIAGQEVLSLYDDKRGSLPIPRAWTDQALLCPHAGLIEPAPILDARCLLKLRQQQGLELTAKQQAELLALAEDLPRLWQAQTTSAKDRKRMLRLLIKDLTIEKRRAERKAILHIRWQGGAIEDLIIDLPLPVPIRIRYPESVVSQVRTLASTMTDLQIAATLNQAQLRSAKGKPFTKDMIKWIRYRYGIPAPVLKRPEEFTVKELAAHFQIGIDVVHYWIRPQLPDEAGQAR